MWYNINLEMEVCFMWIGWLIAIIVLTIIELATVGLVSIWFIASGIVALVVSFFTDSFYIQFLVFGVLGIILLITTRPLLNKYFKPKDAKTNLDRVIGMKGVVTDTIEKDGVGEVKVDGKLWSATSNDEIKKGEKIIVDAMKSVKLIVRKEVDK